MWWTKANESLPTAEEEEESVGFFGRTEQRQDVADILLGLEDGRSDRSPEEYLVEADAILEDLSRVVPTLLDPHDDDDDDHIAYHLEQLALRVIRGEKQASAEAEEEEEPNGQDTSSVSYGTASPTCTPKSSPSEPTWLHVPKPNPEFVGRQGDLRRLSECLAQPGHICVVSGPEGVGKTATVMEHVRRSELECSSSSSSRVVIWFDAGTPDNLADKYNSIGRRIFGLGQPEEEGGRDEALSLMLVVRKKLELWDKRWILIFDNVDTWQDISRYIPRRLPGTAGSVLITTRLPSLIRESRSLQRFLHYIRLAPMTPEEGGKLLLLRSTSETIGPGVAPQDSHHAEEEAKVAIQLAKLAGRLPLALVMIAGYVKARRATLTGFLEKWEAESKQTERRRRIPEGGGASSISLLWDISVGELPAQARNLLEVMALLEGNRIQGDWLVDNEAATGRGMIGLLSGRGLIEIKRDEGGGTESYYRMHRQLQRNIILDVDDDPLRFDRAVKGATLLIRKRFPGSPAIQDPAPQNWEACQEYIPHILRLHRAYRGALEKNTPSSTCWTRELADLFYDAGFYVWDGQSLAVQDGLAFLDAAENILNGLGPDTVEPARRADIHCISGLLRNAVGCRQRADSLQRLKTAFGIRENVYKSHAYSMTHDVLLRNAATDYAISLINYYRFDEAETILNGCLERYHVWGTEREIPFEYSKYYYNMGIVRMWQQEMEEAIRFLQRSANLAKAAFGKRGQYWDNSFMLACCLQQAGAVQTSLDMHLEVLQARLSLLGKRSKSTILSMYAVGTVYANLGDTPTAM